MISRRSCLNFSICIVTNVAVLVLTEWTSVAASPANAHLVLAVYHPDREHLWNRLHDSLFAREGSDGRVYGQDRLEPLIWPHSKHLLEEQSHKRAASILEEFLEQHGEKLIEDPLKRAILQRDLWLLFNWLEGNHGDFAEPSL